MLKHGGDSIKDWLHQIISIVWKTERSAQDWKDSAIVTIFKKGDTKEWGNYRDRGITLLSIPEKVYALLLLDKLSGRMEANVKQVRSTDQLFTLSQILSHANSILQLIPASSISVRPTIS
jgi:hypothetical protein